MKVLIAGPIARGSLPVARAIAAAFTAMGYESNFPDYSSFADDLRAARASGNREYTAAFLGALEKVLIDSISRSRPDIFLGIAPHFDIFFSIQTGAFVKALAEAGANNHY